jgi:L-histidine N-alpha-methyltransferase
MRAPRFIQLHELLAAPLAAEAAAGLCAAAAHVSPKFFYDALGSRLFDAITELDEYYPTRTEAAIMATHQAEMAAAVHRAVGAAPTLVDLGAGNGAKAAAWFQPLGLARYVAIDISVDFLRGSIASLQRQHPAIEMVGLGLDFSADLAVPAGLVEGPSLVFYPGSSIGNFSREQALRLLRQAHALCQGGALLIGVDLRQAQSCSGSSLRRCAGGHRGLQSEPAAPSEPAAGGRLRLAPVAARGAVRRSCQPHRDAPAGAERSDRAWPGGSRRFASGERIHTENSYKWRPEDFEALLREAGFGAVQTWTDPTGLVCRDAGAELSGHARVLVAAPGLGAGPEPGKDVVAFGWEVVAVARVPHARLCAERSTAQDRAAAEPGRRVVHIRVGHKAGVGLEAAAGPFPDLAPGEAIAGRAGRAFPLGLAGQAAAGPGAPGQRFVLGQVAGGQGPIQVGPLAMSPLLPASTISAQVARAGQGQALAPGQAFGGPPTGPS